MDTAEGRVMALDRTHLVLTVNRLNVHAMNFYIKLGFLLRSVTDTDIGGGFEMQDFVMAKRLQGVGETAKLPALR